MVWAHRHSASLYGKKSCIRRFTTLPNGRKMGWASMCSYQATVFQCFTLNPIGSRDTRHRRCYQGLAACVWLSAIQDRPALIGVGTITLTTHFAAQRLFSPYIRKAVNPIFKLSPGKHNTNVSIIKLYPIIHNFGFECVSRIAQGIGVRAGITCPYL